MLKLNLKEKHFGDEVVLSKISIQLKKGERLAILGPSGVGKTTLLRIIAGLDSDFSGSLSAPDNVGLMFQSPNLLLWRNAHDNLAIFHPKASSQSVEKALLDVGLAGKSLHYPHQLSLGQQRRLALARCFLADDELICLDEPFASLDDSLRLDMRELTDRLLQHRALILVTHFAGDAEALGCQILNLSAKLP